MVQAIGKGGLVLSNRVQCPPLAPEEDEAMNTCCVATALRVTDRK